MNLIIKDSQGLGIALQMAGYAQEEWIWARNAMRELFRSTSEKVFQKVPAALFLILAVLQKSGLHVEQLLRKIDVYFLRIYKTLGFFPECLFL